MRRNPIPHHAFRSLTSSAPLRNEEYGPLARAAKAGDEEARQRLVAAHVPLVIGVARSMRWPRLDMDDMVGAGCVGLLEAVDAYDPAKGSLKAFAVPRIYRAIEEYALRAEPGDVRIGGDRQKLLRRAATHASLPDVAAKLGVTQQELDAAREAQRTTRCVSMNQLAYGRGGSRDTTLGELLTDPHSTRFEQRMLAVEAVRKRITPHNRVAVLRRLEEETAEWHA